MLPGGAILLRVVLKIMTDLIPSACKENEIEQHGDEEDTPPLNQSK
jgi:hypothetical protein